MTLYEWSARWGLPIECVADLRNNVFHLDDPTVSGRTDLSEAGAQNLIRMEASAKGLRLWRNNNGALQDATGRWVRYGLANDSTAVNDKIKSADLIGIRPVSITTGHVGHVIGQLVSREVKPPGWRFTNTDREQAQLRWAELINRMGGDAAFATGVGTI